MRSFFAALLGILFLTGCLSSSDTTPPRPTHEQLEKLADPSGDYSASGKILFKYVAPEVPTEGKHSGELDLQLSALSELRLRIFTPLVGSLIYELRADPERFLVLNYQDRNYVLEDNTAEVRQTWLGMDISVEELRWLLHGKIPRQTPTWQRQELPAGELQLLQGTKEIRLRFNTQGYIASMLKLSEGLLEYRAKIPLYRKYYGIPFPRKIKITDYTGNNHWTMVISEIHIPTTGSGYSGFPKKLDFTPPENLQTLFK